uniref:C2H2-type domain-containing protein n=1 Tax=Opuntia streptacantha TaxID=393608 RepID=A0A7C8ZEK9_OPUST
MATNPSKSNEVEQLVIDTEDDEDYDDGQAEGWEDWNADESEDNGDGDGDSEFKCLFCESNFGSCGSFFEHCASVHYFDFAGIKKSLDLDFYGCVKLVNYIRRMVARNTCWSCGQQCMSIEELQNHLHEPSISKELKQFWDDEKYLQPFREGDSLLYSFDQDEDFEEDESIPFVHQEELMKIREEVGNICINDEIMVDTDASTSFASNGKGMKEQASTSDSSVNVTSLSHKEKVNGICVQHDSSYQKKTDMPLKVSFANVAASEIRKVNESYFGSYSSFGIHREMLSDKVRMDAYGQAILKNPSLLNGATVLDVGCGTGILSSGGGLKGYCGGCKCKDG